MKKIGERKKRKKVATIKSKTVFRKGKDLTPDNIKEKIVSLMANEPANEKKNKKNQVCAVIFERSINSLMLNKEGKVMRYAGKGKKMKTLSFKNIEKIVIIGIL